MKILAHRGYWKEESQRNSPQALRTALEKGYGIESDIRDFDGKLVISHNIANAGSQEAAEVFRWLAEYRDKFCFAVNVKADGLKELLLDHVAENQIANYFAFDMSVPQMVEYADMGLTYFTRQSELEPSPVMYEQAAGVWIDGFFCSDWITEKLLNSHLQQGKKVCLVSPELHGREYLSFWTRLAAFHMDLDGLLLCTDYPDEAVAFFENQLS